VSSACAATKLDRVFAILANAGRQLRTKGEFLNIIFDDLNRAHVQAPQLVRVVQGRAKTFVNDEIANVIITVSHGIFAARSLVKGVSIALCFYL
jgi:hypothetical protein